MCSLSQGREHIVLPQGKTPANVMFIFDKKISEFSSIEDSIIRQLNFELKHDWYKTYVIKCKTNKKVNSESLLSCRKWLLKEIQQVNPYLIILFGKLSVLATLGTKYQGVRTNIMYATKNRKYFVFPSLTEDTKLIFTSVGRILGFIKEFYQ